MIGEVFDGHEILRPLGAGGMGEVYLARGGDGALRALKIVRAENAAQASGRFKREVKTLGRLEHPNIIRIFDAGARTGRFHQAKPPSTLSTTTARPARRL